MTLDQEMACRTIIDNELNLLADETAEEDGVTDEELALLRMNLRSLRADVEGFYLDGAGRQARSTRPAELKLRLLDGPTLIVDTAAMRNKPSAFFTDGIAYSYSQDSEGPITQEFDGLIYLQNSQAMTPAKETPCPIAPDWPMPKLPKKMLAVLNATH